MGSTKRVIVVGGWGEAERRREEKKQERWGLGVRFLAYRKIKKVMPRDTDINI